MDFLVYGIQSLAMSCKMYPWTRFFVNMCPSSPRGKIGSDSSGGGKPATDWYPVQGSIDTQSCLMPKKEPQWVQL